jgi:hypothetical protein
MENKSLQEVQKQLEAITEARKKEEAYLHDIQKQLISLQSTAEGSLERLAAVKDEETALQNKVFLMQKEAIKEALSVNGLKKLISDQNPLVKKLKDKGKEIKEVLDGTAFDKQWVDEQYEIYKDKCIKSGEIAKSKEEFKKIALSLKEFKNEGSAQISAIANKASNELKKFGKFFQDSFKTNITVDTQDEVEVIDPPTSKKEGLDLWLKHSGATYDETKLVELYESYTSYLEKTFEDKLEKDVIYAFQGSAFKKAFKKAFEQ